MLKGKVAVVTGASAALGKPLRISWRPLAPNMAVIYAGDEQAAENVCSHCGKSTVWMPRRTGATWQALKP